MPPHTPLTTGRFARGLVGSIAGLGGAVGDGPDMRRARTLNLTSFTALVLNTVFTALFAVMNLSAILPLPFVSNVAASMGYLVALMLSARGRLDPAMWVLAGSALVNLGIAGTFFGSDAPAWIYLLILPVASSLFVPRGSRLPGVIMIGVGSLAFAVVPLVAGTTPEFVSDPALLDVLFFVVAFTTALTISGIAFYYRTVAERAEARAEQLLLNILPFEIADRLKAGESPIADRVPEVTVLFCDIVGSTEMADRLSPDDLVASLNRLFSAIDDIVDECGMEKIKTVGDGYLAVAGLSQENENHPYRAARAALLIRDEAPNHSLPGFGSVRMRIGLHTGPVVAGVIGKRKFSYDVWGDTVNVASRMESTGEPDVIQVSAAVYERIKSRYECRERGTFAIKGKGSMATYVLTAALPGRGR